MESPGGWKGLFMEREEFDRKYIMHLSAQQREAVHAVDGAVLLLAVPGSGKTTVLVMRLGYMVLCRGIDPGGILTMTYTVAATKEMRQRFADMFGVDAAQGLEFRTINGVSSKIIELYGRMYGKGPAFELLEDEGEILKMIDTAYRQVRGDFAAPGLIKDVRTAITYVKNMMLTPEEIEKLDTGIDSFPEIYKRYCAELRSRRSMDFDDQMVYARTILEKYPDVLARFQERYTYFCVDESQDTSKIQHSIIRLLAQKSGNIFMVGDEDQSIYGFRAAYPEALMQFEQSYKNGRVLLMENNYRSTPEILRTAGAFIRRNRARRPKELRPTRDSGAAVHIVHVQDWETQFYYLLETARQGGTPAVLYRNNDSALPLIDLLDRQGIPYKCRSMDDSFFTHRIPADIADIFAFAQNGRDADVFMRIYYKLGSGISRKATEYACQKSGISGRAILEELLSFPELSRYARDCTAELLGMFPLLLTDTAPQGLSRIVKDMRYSSYIDQQKLDKSKLMILAFLAVREPDMAGLFARLAYLKKLTAAHKQDPDAKLLLSTIHASKGLEYDAVYILDVLDGILPQTAAPEDPDGLRQYEEERRLFYVGMTRARNDLFLFHCLRRSSAFVDEVLRELPEEASEPGDVFASLKTELCGKAYTHAVHGAGRIEAHCGGGCLIVYQNGERQYLTLSRMYEQRAITLKRPEPEKKRAGAEPAGGVCRRAEASLSRDEEKRLFEKAVPGRGVSHKKFGAGTIVSFRAPYVEIDFPGVGVKKFIFADAVLRGFLSWGADEE